MRVCVRLVAPAALFVLVALVLAGMGTDPGISGRTSVMVLGIAGAMALAASLGAALEMTARLDDLPALTRATAWGERTGPFPGMEKADEIGRTQRALHDLALSMRGMHEQRAEMERLAMTDPLTGLPNRRGMFRLFDDLAARGEAPGDPHPLGVLHIDLDHFKAVNDRFGHDAGDYVLRQAVRLIASALRDSDALVRLGGDEFIVISPVVDSERTLVRMAERIIARFKEPIVFEDRICEVGASIGLVLGGQRGRVPDPGRLLLHADMALCQAKANGRSGYALFDSAMARTKRQAENRAEELRQALIDNAFEPFLQPVVDIETGRVLALEAFARWRRPGYGALAAEAFIETAEAHSMIEDLGLQVLEKTCQMVAEWQSSGRTVPEVHINVSRIQLLDTSLVDRFGWTLDNHGVEPGQIAIEVAEADLTGRGAALILANLKRLTDLGFSLAIDDFGAADGALGALSLLPVRWIKTGAALTEALPQDGAPVSPQLRCTRALAAEFQVTLAAKHVEEDARHAPLREAGFHAIQGTSVADPMEASAMADWLAERDTARARADRAAG